MVSAVGIPGRTRDPPEPVGTSCTTLFICSKVVMLMIRSALLRKLPVTQPHRYQLWLAFERFAARGTRTARGAGGGRATVCECRAAHRIDRAESSTVFGQADTEEGWDPVTSLGMRRPPLTQRIRSARSIMRALTSATIIVIALYGTASMSAAQPSSTIPASTAQVLKAVAAAATIKSLPSHLTPSLQNVAGDVDSMIIPTILDQQGCVPAVSSATTGKCVFGDPSGSKTIVLLGDSHAGMWWAGFNAMAKRLHWRLVLLMKESCPAVDLSFWFWPTNEPYPTCNAWHQYVVNRINKMDPAVVVDTGAWRGNGILPNGVPPTDRQWQSGLEQFLNSITSPGTKKVVWGDIPYLAQVGPDCLAAHETDVQVCSTPASQAVLTDHEQTLVAAAQATAATYIATTPWLCTSTCTAVVGNHLVYADSAHITSSYAVYLQGAIGEALQPVIAGASSNPPRTP